jgi:tetratricopeptide (TPR) repeat protein
MVAIVVCATLGAYGWQAQRMTAHAKVARPLGADQFAAALPDSARTPTVAAPTVMTAAAPEANVLPIATEPSAPNAREAAAAAEPRPVASPQRSKSAPIPPQAAVAAKSAARMSARDVHAAPATQSPQIVARKDSAEEQQLERAADLIRRGRSLEAMALLAQVLDAQPVQPAARQALAALQAENGRRDLALRTLLAGAALEPARFAIAAARLQSELGDAHGALATLDRMPATLRDADYDALVGGIAQRAGQQSIAVEAFARAVRSPRAQASWWVGFGHSLEAASFAASSQ